VGKTTLLNHLLGRETFETKPVREKDNRGRHTTARRQLTVLESGALFVDTPGMRELGLMALTTAFTRSTNLPAAVNSMIARTLSRRGAPSCSLSRAEP
jgi:putative ribosome biogenesis GTPase RsgA